MARASAAPAQAARLPAWTRPPHPIYRFESSHWKRSRSWRLLRGSLWAVPIILALGLLVAYAAGTLSAGTSASQPESTLVAGATFVVVLVSISALLNWLIGLGASILGATLIARDRESQTWPFLRVTTLSSIEIAGGKLSALLRLLIFPAHAVAALRLAALAGVAVTLAYVAAESGPMLQQAVDMVRQVGPAALLPASTLLLTGIVGGLDLVVWLIYWLIEPYFNLLYNSAIGLAASSLARTRGRAIGLVFVVHLILGLAVYAPIQQIAYGMTTLGFSVFKDPTGNALTMLMLFSVQFGLLIALQSAAMVGSLIFTLKRIERLGD